MTAAISMYRCPKHQASDQPLQGVPRPRIRFTVVSALQDSRGNTGKETTGGIGDKNMVLKPESMFAAPPIAIESSKGTMLGSSTNDAGTLSFSRSAHKLRVPGWRRRSRPYSCLRSRWRQLPLPLRSCLVRVVIQVGLPVHIARRSHLGLHMGRLFPLYLFLFLMCFFPYSCLRTRLARIPKHEASVADQASFRQPLPQKYFSTHVVSFTFSLLTKNGLSVFRSRSRDISRVMGYDGMMLV